MLTLTRLTVRTNCPKNVDWEALCHQIVAALTLTVVDEKFHYFEPQGLTGILLLKESHLSVHTWPEEDLTVFEILSCKSFPVDFDGKLRRLLDSYHLAIKSLQTKSRVEYVERPKPKREFDQFLATAETVAKRVTKFEERDDLRGRRILFLGDDDLDSLAVAATHQPAEIVVLDIDNDILLTIQKTAQAKGYKNLKVFKYDARKSLPKELIGQFDAVFTDPPYTPSGFGTFLARLCSAATRDATIYVCYGYTQKELERPLKIQKLISDWGLLIAEKQEGFNEYTGAKSIGNHSSLYILKKTPQTHVNEKLLQGGFYTYD
jgi:S-adenosylmethionine/arginine decarboxylase-like enzyme